MPLPKSAKAGDWIHDFVHSDAPQFKGKSPEKRKQMALAAYYAKQRNEEVNVFEMSDEALDVFGDFLTGLTEEEQYGIIDIAMNEEQEKYLNERIIRGGDPVGRIEKKSEVMPKVRFANGRWENEDGSEYIRRPIKATVNTLNAAIRDMKERQKSAKKTRTEEVEVGEYLASLGIELTEEQLNELSRQLKDKYTTKAREQQRNKGYVIQGAQHALSYAPNPEDRQFYRDEEDAATKKIEKRARGILRALRTEELEMDTIDEGNKHTKSMKNAYVADRGWGDRVSKETGKKGLMPVYGYRYMQKLRANDSQMGANYKGDKKLGREVMKNEELEMDENEQEITRDDILAEGPHALLDHIANESEDANEIFNTVIGAKIDSLLDNMRQEIAANMFKQEETVETEEK